MPELPEVETCRSTIEPHLVGKRIESVRCSARNYAFLSAPSTIRKNLQGAVVSSVHRRGKYLLIDIEGRGQFMVHLGMTGNLLCLGKEASTPSHVHMELRLSGGARVVYRDPRQFGKLEWLGRKPCERIERLGPEATEIRGEELFAASRKRRIPIKSLLLDQKVLAGVGNIYADEALFRCGIRPTRRSEKLTRKESLILAEAIRDVLARAIECGGSSISDFQNAKGESGYFQINHQVYGRESHPCYSCQTPIKRKVIGQRSSHYCPSCQAK